MRGAILLAAVLLVGCASTHARQPARRYLILDDQIPSNVVVCVPLPVPTEAQQYACMPVDTLRWFLRHQVTGND